MPRGRHTALRVRLTPEQRRTLERWQRTTTLPAALVRRGRLLLLVAAGTPLTEAAGKVGMSRRYVYKWVERFRTEGLGGLADRPRHAPAVRAED